MENTLSALLDRLKDDLKGEDVSIDDILRTLGTISHGIVILAIALPNTFPMPYGIPTLSGVAILIVSVQLLLAPARPIWLPTAIRERRLPRARIQVYLERARPLVSRIERYSHARLEWATGGIGGMIVALLCGLCGLTLLLPIPFVGNIPPAIAAAFLAAGLVQRDGLVVIAGFVFFAGAMAILAAAWSGIFHAAA